MKSLGPVPNEPALVSKFRVLELKLVESPEFRFPVSKFRVLELRGV